MSITQEHYKLCLVIEVRCNIIKGDKRARDVEKFPATLNTGREMREMREF